MELSTRILLLNVFRVVSLLVMTFGIAIFLLLLSLVASGQPAGPAAGGTFVAVVGAFFGRRFCVRELERVNKENPEGAKEATKQGIQTYKYMWLGSFVGAVVGFLLRPAVPLVGQLPLMVVLTRGANLQGLDRLVVPTAETSFNYMLVGGIIGTVLGLLAPKFMAKK